MTPLDREFLKDCAFESTKDDYENIGTLAPEIERWAVKDGHAFAAEVLVEVLQDLVREGKIGVYRYSQNDGRFVEAQFDPHGLQDLWFLAKKG
jgi:hypothetical protein